MEAEGSVGFRDGLVDGTVPADQPGPLEAFRNHDDLEVALVRFLSVGGVLDVEEDRLEGIVQSFFDRGLAGTGGSTHCDRRGEASS